MKIRYIKPATVVYSKKHDEGVKFATSCAKGNCDGRCHKGGS